MTHTDDDLDALALIEAVTSRDHTAIKTVLDHADLRPLATSLAMYAELFIRFRAQGRADLKAHIMEQLREIVLSRSNDATENR